MARRKSNSRTARWGDAAARVEKAAEELTEACEALKEVQQEYSDWYDNLPEGLQQSAVGEKLSAIQDLDLEPDLSSLEGVADMDLPLGFGRD
jgi:ABC-type nitrate/sulfonate/bicarbonate transport system substrate-binding protein